MSGDEDPRFLELSTVFWLHRRSLELYGGLDGVRDTGGIAVPRDDGQLYAAMIAIARRELDKAGLAQVLRKQFPKS